MNPGATARPSALMMRVADSLNLPTPTIFPWCTATSAAKEGPPEPSTTRPFLMSRSYAMTLPPSAPTPRGHSTTSVRLACVHPVTHQHSSARTGILYAIQQGRSMPAQEITIDTSAVGCMMPRSQDVPLPNRRDVPHYEETHDARPTRDHDHGHGPQGCRSQ